MLFSDMSEDQESIEEFYKYLDVNEYLVEASGYGRSFREKDVALSLKR